MLLKTEAIDEIKIQIYNEIVYNKVKKYFNGKNKSYHTYQLNSAKGMKVVIKA